MLEMLKMLKLPKMTNWQNDSLTKTQKFQNCQNFWKCQKRRKLLKLVKLPKMLKMPKRPKCRNYRKYQKLKLEFPDSIFVVFICFRKFSFWYWNMSHFKIMQMVAAGRCRVPSAEVPRASALFLFQLFQIKMNQNRLNKFENSYFYWSFEKTD